MRNNMSKSEVSSIFYLRYPYSIHQDVPNHTCNLPGRLKAQHLVVAPLLAVLNTARRAIDTSVAPGRLVGV